MFLFTQQLFKSFAKLKDAKLKRDQAFENKTIASRKRLANLKKKNEIEVGEKRNKNSEKNGKAKKCDNVKSTGNKSKKKKKKR